MGQGPAETFRGGGTGHDLGGTQDGSARQVARDGGAIGQERIGDLGTGVDQEVTAVVLAAGALDLGPLAGDDGPCEMRIKR